MNEIWERVLANSFSGIHKSKLICSEPNRELFKYAFSLFFLFWGTILACLDFGLGLGSADSSESRSTVRLFYCTCMYMFICLGFCHVPRRIFLPAQLLTLAALVTSLPPCCHEVGFLIYE